VCEECHDELWDRPTPVERDTAERTFLRERREMTWALTVVGLDKWEEILRNFDLTMKPSPREKKERKRRGSESTAASESTGSRRSRRPQSTRASDVDDMPVGPPGVKPELGLDYLNRPTYPHVYGWITPPPCIRFTSSAFKPPSPPSLPPCEETTPSPFGMLKSPAKFVPAPLPPAYVAEQQALQQRAFEASIPRGEAREDLRQQRYKAAVKELIRTAYVRGVPREDLYGGLESIQFLVDPTPMQVMTSKVVKQALDWAARWRGDPIGH